MVENVIQTKSGITINVSVKYNFCKKGYWIMYLWKGRYLENIIGASVITCDEIIEETNTVPSKSTSSKTVSRNFNKMKVTCKTENLYILLAFLSICISLLIAVSIYYCFIKHRLKQKHLFLYHDTSNQLKEIGINNII